MKVCLLITTFNRGSLLRKSFEELVSGGFELPDEVLVVDDGSDDDTAQVCATAADFLPVRRIFHNNPGQTLCSEARNVGLKATDADAIVTCEPECYFESDVIAQMRTLHEQHPECVINAGTVHKLNEHGHRDTLVGWSATHCAFYMREWLMAIGGWDEGFPDPWGWDDTDLLTRLRLTGHGAENIPEIVVVHQFHPTTVCNQDANSGHFFAKGLDLSDDRVVANEGVEWGKLKA
jgi:glycosyltransferase involved in cell wall biosynthesis